MCSKKQHLENAIAAIKIIKSKPLALTDSERAILMQFPGGGVLKECGVFLEKNKPEWLRLGKLQLLEFLNMEEWASLQNVGLQNAHYTSPEVRQVLWDVLTPHLTPGDRVLDPGCGVGGFAVEMPSFFKYVGVEKDELSAAIAKLAHPTAQIYHKDFLRWSYPEKFNLVIGNVPFTNGVQSMKLDGKCLRIGLHAQFFVTAIAHLLPGGLLALLTSTNTLDSRTPDYIRFREWVHGKCEFLGAVRLPSGSHVGETEVTTDLILLRRRVQEGRGQRAEGRREETHPSAFCLRTSAFPGIVGYDGRPAYLSNWYLENPKYLIGEPVCSNLRGKNGNPTTTVALKARPNQDVLGEFKTLLNSLFMEQQHLWTLKKLDDSSCKFYIPDGFITVWETKNKGEWFAVDKSDRNIKRTPDRYRKHTFPGNDVYEAAIRAYNWHLSDNEQGDYFDIYPWVGLKAIGESIYTHELIEGLVTLVNPDGEIVSHICIDSEYNVCSEWVIYKDEQTITSIFNTPEFNQKLEVFKMATVIPADKFKNSSVFSFILRENPKQKGIEIHLPPDCKTDTKNAVDFIAKLLAAGFQQAKTNPKLYCTTFSEQLMTKCRGWVKACKDQNFGAYEISPDEPVEQTPNRRKYNSASKEEKLPEKSTATTSNKLLDAIAQLIDTKLETLSESIGTNIIERLKVEHKNSLAEAKSLKEELEKVKSERDELAVALEQVRGEMLSFQNSYTDLENKCNQKQQSIECQQRTIEDLQQECDRLHSELKELGLAEDEEGDLDSPVFPDESDEKELPVFPDESEQSEESPDFPDESDEAADSPAFEEDEEEGFNLEELDKAGK
ncbi:hypothetical protein VF04_04040 [Nostoc linckia z7]|uniref:Methyltransferase small domain-containing protein n=2 Tax=Nostoc linckia TaxID=92942 RepID=A0A9Q5ZGE3_NOSLI|nr:N-6 DNA methylase [Nostoc linckia]PHK42885.1 hypothetical protein VF12_00740 [Nostoc linckia z15]PHK48042.1 hypothetical protein VF13_01715 [Nostoc linckia z16]PHJ64962.1 hypothetical protein VF02_11525 [Nostoc linckia z1]PHJ70140.1 hypothetical protein VF05_11685 [Nostoc linckia z3]PHJ75041.1 hypothetical protein VF03_11845 [Nostoc linckia z2]